MKSATTHPTPQRVVDAIQVVAAWLREIEAVEALVSPEGGASFHGERVADRFLSGWGAAEGRATFARAWKTKAKEYRAAARFAEGVYRRRESRIRAMRTRLELADRIVHIAKFWSAHDAGLLGAIREWEQK